MRDWQPDPNWHVVAHIMFEQAVIDFAAWQVHLRYGIGKELYEIEHTKIEIIT